MHWPATASRSVVSHASTVVRVTTTERLPVHDRTARCRHAIVAKFPPSSPIVAYAISFVSVACIASEKTSRNSSPYLAFNRWKSKLKRDHRH